MNKILAIAGIAVRTAIRSRVILILFFLLGLAMVGLPLTIRSDGTLEGHVQILLGYTLGLATFILALATIWAGCASVALDIENSTIQLIVSKPVSRLQLWLGKWLGLMCINLVLLACCGLATYVALRSTTRPEKLAPQDRERIHREVLVARQQVFPIPPAVDDDARREAQERMARGDMPDGVTPDEMFQALRERLVRQAFTVAPGAVRSWSFSMPRALDTNAALTLRFRFSSSHLFVNRVTGLWQIGPPDAPAHFQRTDAWTTEIEQTLEIPPGAAQPGAVLNIRYANVNAEPVTVIFAQPNGLAVLIPRGGFESNMVRALLVVLAHLAFLAALSVTAGSLFSMPVAAFISFFVVLLLLTEEYVGSLARQAVLIPRHEMAGTGPTFWDAALRLFYKMIHALVQPLKGADPLSDLALGHLVSWSWVAGALLVNVVVYGSVLALLGAFVLNRREVALPPT